jgi:hypothetical protein
MKFYRDMELDYQHFVGFRGEDGQLKDAVLMDTTIFHEKGIEKSAEIILADQLNKLRNNLC